MRVGIVGLGRAGRMHLEAWRAVAGVQIAAVCDPSSRVVYLPTAITIADRVLIGAGVIFTNDRYPRAFADGVDGLASSAPTEDTPCGRVDEGASIGAGARIGPGVTVGSYAMVGMGAVVTAEVPAHALVVGNPARIRGWVCICGRPLPSDAPDALLPCGHCGRRFDWSEGPVGRMVQCRD